MSCTKDCPVQGKDIANFQSKFVFQFNMLYISILFAYRKFFYDGNIQRQDNLQFKQKYVNKCVL